MELRRAPVEYSQKFFHIINKGFKEKVLILMEDRKGRKVQRETINTGKSEEEKERKNGIEPRERSERICYI